MKIPHSIINKSDRAHQCSPVSHSSSVYTPFRGEVNLFRQQARESSHASYIKSETVRAEYIYKLSRVARCTKERGRSRKKTARETQKGRLRSARAVRAANTLLQVQEGKSLAAAAGGSLIYGRSRIRDVCRERASCRERKRR